MGSRKRNTDMSMTDEIKIVAAPEAEQAEVATETTETEVVESPKKAKTTGRSQKYHSVRAKIDKTKQYEPTAAIELVKKLSYSKFVGSLELHAVVKEASTSFSVSMPHSTGRALKVAIATDELLKEIEGGTIAFDVLVSSPQFMPKLAKLARVLGPKGLMPNPKSGTLTDNPELKKKELEGGKVTIKTEKKAPLVHMVIGKLDMDTTQLAENLTAVLKALRGKAEKVSLSATMSPGVKIALEQ